MDLDFEDCSLLRIEVRDNGKGIADLCKVGSLFGNLDIIENVNQSGVGFGLAIS